MKRSKITSFLFTIALGLLAFSFGYSQATNSADCQDMVNISLGDECNVAIPYEAFNTWEPACMLIKDSNGNTVAALSGTNLPAGVAAAANCFVAIDSIWFDTVSSYKRRVTEIPAWEITCGNAVNAYVYEVDYPEGLSSGQDCSRNTYFANSGSTNGIGLAVYSGVVNLLGKGEEAPDGCSGSDQPFNREGYIVIVDTVWTYYITIHNQTKPKRDTFSHTDRLRWIRGTQLANVNGVIDTINGYNAPASGSSRTEGPIVCDLASVYEAGETHSSGSAKLGVGDYTYSSYTYDGQNFCWGKIQTEFKLLPTNAGQFRRVSCIDISDYSRAPGKSGEKTYDVSSPEKLENLCPFLEDALIIREDDDIEDILNASTSQCFTYDVTHEDVWIKNFDWLCDTVEKHRIWYSDLPAGHGGSDAVQEIGRDTVEIIPIYIEDVLFPDSVVVMDCGILDSDDPAHIAEYLYHAYEKGKSSVITGPNTAGSQYTIGSVCDAFLAQYPLNFIQLAAGGNLSPGADDLCEKAFLHADYNNWGVEKAFPHIQRTTAPFDIGLYVKYLFADFSGDITNFGDFFVIEDVIMTHVSIPISKIVCNIAASHTDLDPIDICAGERKIFRNWTLVDWCTGTTVTKTQVIKYIDRLAPVITSWDGVQLHDTDDDNTFEREDGYFGNNHDTGDEDNDDASDHLTKVSDMTIGEDPNTTVIRWIKLLDHTDYDGDANASEDAPWVQRANGDGEAYMYTRYEKVTNPWNCLVSHTFPVLTFKEHCSEAQYTFELVNHDGFTDGNVYQAGETATASWEHEVGLEYPIVRINIWDDCENDYEYYYYLKANDKLPPIVVLHDKITVTLTADTEPGSDGKGEAGIAKVFCENVDAGSHDGDCGDLQACGIRRKGSNDAWADHVKLTCDDIGEVEVEYRAVDWSGNTAIGWTVIEVENKNGPFIVCEDLVVDCDDPIHPDWVGYPHVFGICNSPELEYEDEKSVDDLCYTGTIRRTWRVKDTDVQCTQIITISSNDDGADHTSFDPRSIRWPLHHTGENWMSFIDRIDGFDMWDVLITDQNLHGACGDFQFHTVPDDDNAGNSNDNGDVDTDGDANDDGILDYNEETTRAQAYTQYLAVVTGNDEWDDNSSAGDALRRGFLADCSMYDHFECELGELTEPTWTDPVCGLVGKSFTDEHFKFNDGVCFKIVRRWAIIDWCTWEANEDDSDDQNDENNQYVLVKDYCEGAAYFKYGGTFGWADEDIDGYYTWDQEIKVVDETPPVITVEDVTADVNGGGKNSTEPCVGTALIPASAEDFCGMDLVEGEAGTKEEGPELDWFVKIQQLDHDGNPIGSPSDFQLIANGGNEVGNYPLYSHENSYTNVVLSIDGKAGEHYLLKWRVEDGCNNAAEMESHVWFGSDKAPVLICFGDLSTNAMSTDGTTEIWASDFGEAQDCEGNEVQVYFKDADGNATPTLTLTCDDLGGNTSFTWEGRVYAANSNGDEAFCEVALRVVDSNNACGSGNSGSSGIISGEVRTALGDMVEKARVSMDASFDETSIEGKYAFEGITGNSYSIAASKDDNYMNGVSTLDLVLIQKHILGLKLLDSPYKVISADVNNDTQISSIDLVQLRKLILGLYEGDVLPNNDSWRFADAAQTFENALSPFPFVEKINIESLSTDRNDDDFLAMKIGDVSGDAIANSGIASGRTTSTLNLFANESSLIAGQNVSVTISSDNFVDMNALQFTLNTAGLELVGITSGAIEMDENSIAIHDNAITVAWFSENAVSATDALFTFEFRAIADVALSNALSISSHITEAKAYDATAEGFDVALTFNTGEGTVDGATFELFQNTPNPFEANTRIAFQLGQAGSATLTIFDVTGKTVKVVKGQFERGLNSITIESSELGVSGVLYYQLESGDFVATRKMILVR